MFHLLTRAWIILSFSLITAEVYDDLEATYGVPIVPEEDENVPNGDDYGEYGDEKKTNGDEYGDYGYDYGTDDDESYLVNISFSAERLKEMYTCLCIGTYMECNVHFSIEGHTWTVTSIEKNGSFIGDSSLCKYYRCSHVADSQKIACGQVEDRLTACGSDAAAQFFRQKSHDCCGTTCVGLFWSSVEEQLSFLQNSSDIEGCDDSCLCHANGEDGSRVTKIVAPEWTNGTVMDKYIIQKGTTDSSTAKTSDTLSSVSVKNWNTLTTSTVNDGLAGTVKNHSQSGGISSTVGINENAESRMIMATVIAGVASFIIICCVIIVVMVLRKRKRRSAKLNDLNNTQTEPETAAILSSEPQLNSARPIHTKEINPAHRPDVPLESVTTNSLHEYEQSPITPGYLKNGVTDLEKSEIGSKEGNNVVPKKNSNPKSGPPVQAKNVFTRGPNFRNEREDIGRTFDIDNGNKYGSDKHRNNLQNSRKFSNGPDTERVNWQNSENGKSSVLIHDNEKLSQGRRAQNNKSVTGGKSNEDVESSKPLLTKPEVRESVV